MLKHVHDFFHRHATAPTYPTLPKKTIWVGMKSNFVAVVVVVVVVATLAH